MKIKWIRIAALIPTMIMITAISAWSNTITLDVLDSYIEVGETFSVNVYIQEAADSGDLMNFGFDVDDSSSLVAYTGYEITVSDWTDNGHNANNTLDTHYVAGLWLPDWVNDPTATNAGDSILLATLFFTAGSSEGTTTLSIIGENDGDDVGAYYTDYMTTTYQDILESREITTHETTATVPVPGTLLLFGSGFAGFSCILRKTQKRSS